jgi:hypothetical protein
MRLQDILRVVFNEVDANLIQFNADPANNGTFFSSQRIPLTPKLDNRLNGMWTADGDLSALHINAVGSISISLIPDMTKLGLIIPNSILNSFIDYDYDLLNNIGKSFNGKSPDIIRDMGNKTLFDYIFSGSPFSADWLLQCGDTTFKGELARSVLAYTLAGKAVFMWDSACKVLFNAGSSFMTDWIITLKVAKILPKTIFSDAAITLMNSAVVGGEALHLVKTALSDQEFTASLEKVLSASGAYTVKKVNTFSNT